MLRKLRKLLLVLSAAAMLTFSAAPAFAQQTAEAEAENEIGDQVGLVNQNQQQASATAETGPGAGGAATSTGGDNTVGDITF